MTNNDNNKEKWATLAIITCSLLWGVGFPALKSVEELPTFLIISIRFIIASIMLTIVFWKRFKRINKSLMMNAFILSFLIFIMYVFATVGIKYTTSAKASFFCCLSFLIIPFLNRFIYKQKITMVTVVSVLLCFIGIFLLSYTSEMGLNLALGDIICIGASLAASFQIVLVDRMTKKIETDPTLLSIWMMIFVAVWGSIAALFTDSYNVSLNSENIVMLIIIGLFCTAIPYVLQFIGQKYVPSTRVGLINALEPTSGAIISVIMLGEHMSLYGWIGGFIVICSLVYLELMNARKKA